MKWPWKLQRGDSAASSTVRKHLPWIDSPLDVPTQAPTTDAPRADAGQTQLPHDILAFDGSREDQRDSKLPPFKHHHESSTVELFYDLFFVANLATFTVNHEIVDAKSLKNYIGFFTLLWFTWLETSLFDVRFASDSFFNRFFKAVSFGVMTGFAVCGAIYDTTDVQDNLKAFRAMSLVLMVSRLALIVQYGVILWYLRNYQNAKAPLLATMATLFVAAMIFLGTFFGFPDEANHDHSVDMDKPETYIAWYVVVCVEAAAIITISCVWRVVSFKRTHLVERVGLLTLIIMGEGIIGMTKSVSQILQNSSDTAGSDICIIMSSVLLIYFIWVLYFDQIEHDRFGTIRQQIWAILHYPLHVAILLTVEGSTALILWNIILRYAGILSDYLNAPPNLNSTADLLHWLEGGILQVEQLFKHGELEEVYNYHPNLTALGNITAPYNSTEWDRQADPIIDDLIFGIIGAIFEHFGIEPSAAEIKGGISTMEAQLQAYVRVFETVFSYFYIAAGSFLVVLGVLYWFGKTRKTTGEWLSILVRAVFGVGLAMFCLASFVSNGASEGFTSSYWPIPVVMIMYFVVIVLDNILVWHTNKTIAKQTAHHRADIEMPLETPTPSPPRRRQTSLERPPNSSVVVQPKDTEDCVNPDWNATVDGQFNATQPNTNSHDP